MKKLFENWKRYINEGDDWHSDEYETMADRKWADNPNNPDYKDPNAEDIPKDEEGNLQWDNVEMPSDLDQKATSLWEHLNGLLKQWRPTEGEAIQYKKDLYNLMDDFLKSPDKSSPGSPESPDEDYTDADHKAAEEILATRMGSYRGTYLPGGKKIK